MEGKMPPAKMLRSLEGYQANRLLRLPTSHFTDGQKQGRVSNWPKVTGLQSGRTIIQINVSVSEGCVPSPNSLLSLTIMWRFSKPFAGKKLPRKCLTYQRCAAGHCLEKSRCSAPSRMPTWVTRQALSWSLEYQCFSRWGWDRTPESALGRAAVRS